MEIPQEQEEVENSDAPEGGEGDLSQGYCITFEVRPDGFRVSDPKPLDAEPMYGDAEPQADSENASASIEDLTTAIKELLHVVKAHPLGQDALTQMTAGYDAE